MDSMRYTEIAVIGALAFAFIWQMFLYSGLVSPEASAGIAIALSALFMGYAYVGVRRIETRTACYQRRDEGAD